MKHLKSLLTASILLSTSTIAMAKSVLPTPVLSFTLVNDTVTTGEAVFGLNTSSGFAPADTFVWKVIRLEGYQTVRTDTVDSLAPLETWLEEEGNYRIILRSGMYADSLILRVNKASYLGGECSEMCGNLVGNPSFECYSPVQQCPKISAESNYKEDFTGYFWRLASGICANNVFSTGTHDGTPDHLYMQYTSVPNDATCWDMTPPVSTFINQAVNAPVFGPQNSYVMIKTRGDDLPAGPGVPAKNVDNREYLQQKLNLPLSQAGTYTLSFYVSLSEMSERATDLQVVLSSIPPRVPCNTDDPISIDPMNLNFRTITFPISTFLACTTKTNWVKLSTTLTVNASDLPYNYITIGNFQTDTAQGYVNVAGPPAGYDELVGSNLCFYAVDDIFLGLQDDNCCGESDVIISPGFDNGTPIGFSNISAYSGQISNGTTVYVNGILNIDQSFAFNNNDVYFAPNAQVLVDINKKLTVENTSHLMACTDMWEGIDVFASNAKVEVRTNSLIEDAYLAIHAINGSEVKISSSTFNLNYEGLRLENYAATWPLTFSKNIFTCTGPLKNYNGVSPGSQSAIHVRINHVGHANLAPFSGASDKNIFRYADVGLSILNSEVRLANSTFENISKTGTAGWCIRAEAGNNLRVLDITDHNGASPILPNLFKNSDNGIHITGGSGNNRVFEVEIFGNKFENMRGYGIQVDKHINPTYDVNLGHINIQQNDFSTYTSGGIHIGTFRAISVFRTERMFVKILDNHLQNGANRFNSIGIEVINPAISSGHVSSSTPYYRIENNEVNRFMRGIYTESLPQPRIFTNDVHLEGTGTDQYQGIWSRINSVPNVIGNDVFGDYLDWRSIGIRTENCFSTQMGCNYTTETGIAQWFLLQNKASKIFYNQMDDYERGIQLTAGSFGVQYRINQVPYVMRNKWEKNSTNAELYKDDNSGNPVIIEPDNRFYLFPATGHPYPESDQDFSSQTNIGIAIPFHNGVANPPYDDIAPAGGGRFGTFTYTCPPEDAADIIIRPRGFSLVDLAEEDSVLGGFVPENQWHASRQLYYFLRQYPTFLDSSLVLENWYDSVHATPTRNFYDAYSYLAGGLYAEAESSLDTLTGLTGMPDEYREVLLEMVREYYDADTNAAYVLDSTNRALIEDMADNCPVEYGDLVFMARRLLLSIGGDTLEMTSECEEAYNLPEYSPKYTQPENTISQVLVYPNPASQNVWIQASFSGEFSLLDLMGRTLRNGNMEADIPVEISVLDIPAGMYSIAFRKAGILQETFKLVITH